MPRRRALRAAALVASIAAFLLCAQLSSAHKGCIHDKVAIRNPKRCVPRLYNHYDGLPRLLAFRPVLGARFAGTNPASVALLLRPCRRGAGVIEGRLGA